MITATPSLGFGIPTYGDWEATERTVFLNNSWNDPTAPADTGSPFFIPKYDIRNATSNDAFSTAYSLGSLASYGGTIDSLLVDPSTNTNPIEEAWDPAQFNGSNFLSLSSGSTYYNKQVNARIAMLYVHEPYSDPALLVPTSGGDPYYSSDPANPLRTMLDEDIDYFSLSATAGESVQVTLLDNTPYVGANTVGSDVWSVQVYDNTNTLVTSTTGGAGAFVNFTATSTSAYYVRFSDTVANPTETGDHWYYRFTIEGSAAPELIVPEPSTWALLVFSLGMLYLGTKRGRA